MLPPILVYEKRCGFCRRAMLRAKARTGSRVLYLPRETPLVPRLLGVSQRAARQAVQLVETDGNVYQGAEAVFRTLGRAPGLALITRIARLPVLRWGAELVYRWVSRHRPLAGRIDRALFGRDPTPPSNALVRSLFVRGMGAAYLAAFTSLGAQVRGLYGRRGVSPIAELLDLARERLGDDVWKQYPSIFLAGASDDALTRACRAGQLLSIGLMLGVAPRPTLFALWGLYLSFVSTGREFLSFQWDVLLLETGVAAFVVAPSGLRPGLREEEPPWPAVLLMRWHALRFFYEAGIAKVRSGDETWRARTACRFHYGTQPLPTPLAWTAHSLPRWCHGVSTEAALDIERWAPFLAFAPRRLRRAGFGLLVGLQGLIAATGNYGFFNALSAVMSLWLLDDAVLVRARPLTRPRRTSGLKRLLIGAGAAVLFSASLGAHLLRYGRRAVPEALARLVELGQRAHSLGAYGLFASMTTERPEVVIEASDDAVEWTEYSFRYKPGDPRRGGRWIAPHQPRLDWQMWFAALGAPPRWFFRLLQRLLEASPDVLALLEHAPFGDRPPRYVRAVLYDYRMNDRATRRRTGEHWQRTRLGLYVPAVSLTERTGRGSQPVPPGWKRWKPGAPTAS